MTKIHVNLRIWAILISVLVLSVFVVLDSQTGHPVTLSLLDREVLKRTESQLQTLQFRYQAEAAPIVKEHDDVVSRNCTQAGFAVIDCNVDAMTGAVTKKVVAPTKK